MLYRNGMSRAIQGPPLQQQAASFGPYGAPQPPVFGSGPPPPPQNTYGGAPFGKRTWNSLCHRLLRDAAAYAAQSSLKDLTKPVIQSCLFPHSGKTLEPASCLRLFTWAVCQLRFSAYELCY